MTSGTTRDVVMEPAAAEWRPLHDRAIDWLGRSLGWFDPFAYPSADRRGRLAARKALVELASLLLQQRQIGARTHDERYAAMVDRLAAVAARRSYRDLIARQHRTLWLYGLVYAALRAWGRDDSELRAMLEQAVVVRYPVTWERLPFRYLDYINFLDAGGVAHSLLPAQQVFPSTLLSSAPNVAELEEDDVYAITHAVFYMTAYGADESRWPDGFDRRDAAELIETLLWEYAIAEHADLTAELLICAACLGVARGDAAAAGWELLQRLQLPNGAIPAPAHLVSRAYPGERDDPAYVEWRRCYHTTLMSAMAGISHTHAAHEPAAPRAGSATAGDASAGAFARRLASALQRAHAWLRDSGAEVEAVDVLLASAATARDANDPDPSLPLDGRTVLSLARSAMFGNASASTRARWGVHAVRAFRDYRLDDAAIIGSVIALGGGANDRAVRDVVDALLAQQRLDGSFGYAAADTETGEVSALRRLWTARIAWALEGIARPDALRAMWEQAMLRSRIEPTSR